MGTRSTCAAEEMTMLARQKEGVATDARLRRIEEGLTMLVREVRLNRWLLVFVIAWVTFLRVGL